MCSRNSSLFPGLAMNSTAQAFAFYEFRWGQTPLTLSFWFPPRELSEKFEMRSYGIATRFDHGQPEVSKFFQSEGSHFRADSELDNGIHLIQMDERHRHCMALQLVGHRSLI